MRVVSLLIAVMAWAFLMAAPANTIESEGGSVQLPDSIEVGLIVCDPGPEIFELYGHQAVRVSGRVGGRQVDAVFNYGMFDFNSPGFVYRFVKGATDYYADVQPTDYFLYVYDCRGSRVTEYPLHLSSTEKQRFLDMLVHDVQPEHRNYRYKYFSNNCATRVLDNLDRVLGRRVEYKPGPGMPEAKSYRELLEHYNAGYPWYQLGIDIALGCGIDAPMSNRERMFVPIELGAALPSAQRPDGHPLVGEERVLVPGSGDVRQSATPWYLSPMVVLWVAGVLVAAAFIIGRQRGRMLRGLYAAWCLLLGLAGILVWFLTFLSEHEGTAPNLLVVWLNPLWLAIVVSVWCRSQRFSSWLFMAEGVAGAITLAIWPFGLQHFNVTLLPVLLATLVMCVCAVTPRRRLSAA